MFNSVYESDPPFIQIGMGRRKNDTGSNATYYVDLLFHEYLAIDFVNRL